jgi:protein SCO1
MTSKTERSGLEAPRNPQRRHVAGRWLAMGGAAGLAAAGAAAWAGREAAAQAARGPAGSKLPDLPLVTQDGKTVRFYSDLVRGKVVFINMMYAQCSVQCPPTTQNLKRAYEALGARAGKDIFMYSISLTPEADSPAALRAYMKQQGVGPNWTFLTGRPEDVDRIRRGLGFADPDPKLDGDLTRHTGMVRVGNDALDRWTMTPSMVSPGQILECLMAVDPVTRASGRIHVA